MFILYVLKTPEKHVFLMCFPSVPDLDEKHRFRTNKLFHEKKEEKLSFGCSMSSVGLIVGAWSFLYNYEKTNCF